MKKKTIIEDNRFEDDDDITLDNIKPEKKEKKQKGKDFTQLKLIIIIVFCALAIISYYLYFKGRENVITFYQDMINASILLAAFIAGIFAFNYRSRIANILKGATGVLVLGFFAFNIGTNINIIKLPTLASLSDYTNVSIANVVTWANENNVKIIKEYEYSDNIPEGNIISQSINRNTVL